MSILKRFFGKNKKPTEDFKHDFSTPEGAILCLEDAYSAKDMEKVIACKDFHAEAGLMLARMTKDGGGFGDHPALREQTAKALKLSFMKNLLDSGFPDYTNVIRTFPKREMINPDLFLITEICLFPDKSRSELRVHVGKTSGGWRVLNTIE